MCINLCFGWGIVPIVQGAGFICYWFFLPFSFVATKGLLYTYFGLISSPCVGIVWSCLGTVFDCRYGLFRLSQGIFFLEIPRFLCHSAEVVTKGQVCLWLVEGLC